MAQHGLHDLSRLTRKLGERRGPRELMLHRHERHTHANHAPDVRPPHPGAANDQLRLDASLVRLHGPDPAVLDLDAGYLGLAVELRAALGGQPSHRLARPDALGYAVGRDEEAAQDPVRVKQRYLLRALIGGDKVRLQTPRGGEAVPALEVSQPLGGLRNLYAADLVATRLAVHLEFHVAPDTVLGQVGHHLGRVGLEHEPGSVGGGPASLEERPLIQDHHIPPSEPAQMLGHAAADDAGPTITTPALLSIHHPRRPQPAVTRPEATRIYVRGLLRIANFFPIYGTSNTGRSGSQGVVNLWRRSMQDPVYRDFPESSSHGCG